MLTEEQKQEIRQRLSSLKINKNLDTQGIINKAREKVETQSFQDQKDIGFFEKVGMSAKDRFQNIKESFGRQGEGIKKGDLLGGQSPLETGIQSAGEVAGFIFDVIGSGVSEIGEAVLPEDAERKIYDTVQKLPDTKIGQTLIGIAEDWDEFSKSNPRLASNINSVINIASIVPTVKAAQGITSAGKSALQTGKSVITKQAGRVKSAVLPKTKSLARTGAEKVGLVQKIRPLEEIIQQKPTKKVIQQALKENRVVRNKYNILTGKKEDVILPSSSVKKSADVIKKRIAKDIINSGDDQKILTAIKKEVGTMSNQLRPSFKKVELSPQRKTNIMNRWFKTKKTQANAIDFDNTVAKMQTQFEDRLNSVYKRIRDNKTGKFRQKDLNDLWEIRKAYDTSVSDSIKNASSLSSGSLQLKKEIWLENRKILNDIMEQESKKLGTSSREAFREMSSLYEAEGGILSQATLPGSQPGIFQPFQFITKIIGLPKIR